MPQVWLYTVEGIRAVLDAAGEVEDYPTIDKSMKAVADILDKAPCFSGFTARSLFRRIPRRDVLFSPVEYANRLLDLMYDFADVHRIWIK